MKLLLATLSLLSAMSLLPTSASADENPPFSPWILASSGAWLNTATHVYEPYPLVSNGQTYLRGAFWMFSAKHLRVKIESLSAPVLAANLTAQLPNYWQRATRGIGQIEVVDGEYDVHLFATGGSGISNHKNEQVLGRWTSMQYVYESNYGFRATNEQAVLIALHEIGHNWCCEGPQAGTGANSHYLNVNDGLMGVVDDGWAKAHGYAGCPADWCASPSFDNGLFSDRELRTMGLLP